MKLIFSGWNTLLFLFPVHHYKPYFLGVYACMYNLYITLLNTEQHMHTVFGSIDLLDKSSEAKMYSFTTSLRFIHYVGDTRGIN